jgi:hypothetical protein
MEEIHRMGANDEDDDGFTKVSKKSKKMGVRFGSSAELLTARIDSVPEDEDDTPLPLASDPLHKLEREVYSKRTPGAPVEHSMGGDANRRLDPADSKDGKYIANVSPPTPPAVPLAIDLLDSRQNAIDILFIEEAPINFICKVPSATNPTEIALGQHKVL